MSNGVVDVNSLIKAKPKTVDVNSLIKKKDTATPATTSTDGAVTESVTPSSEPVTTSSDKGQYLEGRPEHIATPATGIEVEIKEPVPIEKEQDFLKTFGKSAWNVLRYQLPSAAVGTWAATHGAVQDILDADSNLYPPFDVDENGQPRMIRDRLVWLSDQPKKPLNQFTPQEQQAIKNDRELLKKEVKSELITAANKIQEQGAKYTEGLVNSLDKVESPLDALNWMSNAMGQAIGQIPVSAATLGASSMMQEVGGIYLDAVQKTAEEESKKRGVAVTPQQVIQEGLDEPAIAITFGLAAGALDYAGAGKVMNAFSKSAFGKELKERGMKMLLSGAGTVATESLTEGAQTALEQAAAQISAGRDVSEIEFDYKEIGEAMAQGGFGAGGITATGALIGKVTKGKSIKGDLVGVPATEVERQVATMVGNGIIDQATAEKIIAEKKLVDEADAQVPQEIQNRKEVVPLVAQKSELERQLKESSVPPQATEAKIEAIAREYNEKTGAPLTEKEQKELEKLEAKQSKKPAEGQPKEELTKSEEAKLEHFEKRKATLDKLQKLKEPTLEVAGEVSKTVDKKDDIEERRQEELRLNMKEYLADSKVGTPQEVPHRQAKQAKDKEINAKYDAELAALKSKPAIQVAGEVAKPVVEAPEIFIDEISEEKDNAEKIDVKKNKDGFSGDFLNDYELIGQGSEHTVYSSKDRSHVIRLAEPYSDKSDATYNKRVDDALLIDEIVGDGSLEVIGYYESPNGTKNPIYKQSFQEGKPLSEQEVIAHLKSLGAVEVGDKYNKGYAIEHNGKTYKISDLTDNFFKDKNGKIVAIDAAIQEIVTPAAKEVVAEEKVEIDNRKLTEQIGQSAKDLVVKSEERGIPVDRKRLLETAKKIAEVDGKKGVPLEAVAEALQYEVGYPDDWTDLRNAIKKGGVELNAESIQRQIDVGVKHPKDILEAFENFKNQKKTKPVKTENVQKEVAKQKTPSPTSQAKGLTVEEGTKVKPEPKTTKQQVAQGEAKETKVEVKQKPETLTKEETKLKKGLPEGTTVIKATDSDNQVEIKIKKKAIEANQAADDKGISLKEQKNDLVAKMQSAVAIMKGEESVTPELEKELNEYGIRVVKVAERKSEIQKQTEEMQAKADRLDVAIDEETEKIKGKITSKTSFEKKWEIQRKLRGLQGERKVIQEGIDKVNERIYNANSDQLEFQIKGDGTVRVGLTKLADTLEMTKEQFPDTEEPKKKEFGGKSMSIGKGGKRAPYDAMAGRTPAEALEIAKDNLDNAKGNKELAKIMKERLDYAQGEFDDAKERGEENTIWAEHKSVVEREEQRVQDLKDKEAQRIDSNTYKKNGNLFYEDLDGNEYVATPTKGGYDITVNGKEMTIGAKKESDVKGVFTEIATSRIDSPTAYEKPDVAPAKRIKEKLNKLKIDTSGKRTYALPFPPQIWNAFVDVVIKSVEAGAEIAQAIKDGVAWLKANHPDEKSADYESKISKEFGEEVKEEGKELEVKEKSESKEKKKTLVTKRAYEGKVREGVKKELEKIGLTREVENLAEAQEKAKAFVESVGEEDALNAIRNNDVEGAMAAYVFNEIAESIDNKINTEKDQAKLDELNAMQAALLEEWGKLQRASGAFNSAMQTILPDSILGFNLERRIQEYKDINAGVIPADVEARFREYDRQLKEVNQKLAEAEQRAKEAEEKATIQNIKDAVEREKKTRKEPKIFGRTRIAKGAQDLIKALGEPTPGLALASKLPSVAKALTEIGQGLIEEGKATFDNVVEKIEDYLNENFKGKVDFEKYRDEVIQKFQDIQAEAGKIKIPHSVIRDFVERGIDNISDLTTAIQELYPDATERQIRDAITGYGKISNPNMEEIEVEIRKMKRAGRVISALEDVANKKRPLRSGRQRDKFDAQERALNKELREAMKDLPVDEATEAEQLKTQLDTAKQRVQNQIEDLQREIDKGELTPKNARTVQEDAELTALKEQRDALKKEHEQIFKDEEFQNKKRLEATKKATERRIKELERRIREKDFAKKEKKPLIADTELNKLRAEKIRIQEEYNKEFYKAKLQNRTTAEKVKDHLWDAWNLTRALRATGELSFVLLQGLPYTVSHPLQATEAMKNSLRFMASPKKTEAWLNNLRTQDYYPILKESKLSITEPNAEITAREELFYSGWTDMIWNNIGKIFGKKAETWQKLNPLHALERASVGYLDTQRVLRFLDGVEMLKEKGIEFQDNKQAYKDMADVINTFTGRASIGRLDPNILSKVFFSPRNWASSIKTATPYAFYHFGKMRAGAESWKPSVAQKMAIADFTKFVGLTTSMVALAAIALNDDDDEETKVELDPRSSDFGKIKMGDTRIDPWGGRIQQIVFLSRMISDSIKNAKGETVPLGTPYKAPTRAELMLQMATNKLAPSASILEKYLTSKEKKDGTRVDKFGNPYDISQELKENLYPIYWETVSELMKDDPNAMNGLLAFYAFFGGGVNVYEPKPEKEKKSKAPLTPEERKKLKEEAIEKSKQLREEYLKKKNQ